MEENYIDDIGDHWPSALICPVSNTSSPMKFSVVVTRDKQYIVYP